MGAFLANITTAGPVLSDLAIAAGNTLEAVVGAFLLSRVAGFRPSLERVRDVVSLVVLAGLLSTAISATIGVTSLSDGWARSPRVRSFPPGASGGSAISVAISSWRPCC